MERINTAATRAINALPPDEADDFDAAVANYQHLAEHFDSFRRVATELVDGLPEIVPVAPPAIWDQIVTQTGIGSDSAPTPSAHTPARPQNTPARSSRLALWMSIGAIAAAFTIGLSTGTLIRSAEQSPRDLAAAAAAEPGSSTIELANPAGMTDVFASVVMTADGTGYVDGDSLPSLSADRTYQLWVIVGDQVVSAGQLGNDPEVVQFRAEGDIVGMAISNEPAGGVVVSQVDPVAVWLRGD